MRAAFRVSNDTMRFHSATSSPPPPLRGRVGRGVGTNRTERSGCTPHPTLRLKGGGGTFCRSAAIIVVLAALASSAHADTFKLGGRTVLLELPRGFCALDPKRPKEAEIIDLNEQMQQPRNHVILQLADCDQLAGFRAGERQVFDRYGQYFTPATSGAAKFASGYTRQAYLAAAAQELPKLDSGLLLDQLTKKFHASGSDVAGARFMGVLDQDPAAIYLGIAFGTMTTAKRTVAASAVGVVGLTLVNGTSISLGLYQVNAGADSVPDLLQSVREQMAALVRANAAIELRESRYLWHGLNLEEIARQAFYVAMMGIGAGFLGWLWLRHSLRRDS